jgi:cell division protein FtsB
MASRRRSRSAAGPRGGAAARRRGAAPRSPIRWDRVGRVALLATLGIIVLLYISPTRHWIAQSRTAADHRAELRALERDNARLKRRVRALRRPDALEQEARRMGMVRRGERSYVIENLPR